MKKKLVLISAYEMSFVKNDISLLQKEYDVTPLLMPGITKKRSDVLRSVVRIFRAVLQHDIAYCWFADFRAWVAVKCARVLNKKVVVVVGGYEVVSMPEINYGGLLHTHMTSRLVYTLNRADLVLAVSHSNMQHITQVAKPQKLQCIYNGVNLLRFTPGGPKEKLVITVGIVKRANLSCKGLVTYALVAARMPEVQFVIIGHQPDDAIHELRNSAPPNLQFVDYLPQDELVHWYRRAHVYAQLSAQESFCLALAEAMLCNCIPVTTDRGALPEVRGDFGYEVPYNDVNKTVEAIRAALDAEVDTGQRRHIEQFSDIHRQEKLLSALGHLQ